jgi:fructose/tagatose bisphosphate aldolase
MTDPRAQLIGLYGGAVRQSGDAVQVSDATRLKSDATDEVVRAAVFGAPPEREAARWLLWEIGQAVGVRPSSIAPIYFARGRGECGGFTVPAINVRMLAYDTARAIFRAAKARDAGAILLEIARSEIAYTDQRPAEYVSVLIAAALREGYLLPIFIQGDHCQVNAKKYQGDPAGEVAEVKKLIGEEIGAGFYNIDVDTSTLVDLSRPTLLEQQRLNFEHAAEITQFIREREPEGVSVSVGAEIGEVGHKNSTVEELRAFMEGYEGSLKQYGAITGISKISVQTGTSHGGVVLPDGTIAKVKLDLDALADLSKAAREEYGMAGAVQHGASTLPADAFGNFSRLETAEIHLATNFQSLVFDHAALPAELRRRMYEWLDGNAQGERKDGDTPEQFYYKARKKAIGPFKKEVWSLPEQVRQQIAADLERTFGFLFDQLNVGRTAALVRTYIQAPYQAHGRLQRALVTAVDDAEAGE